MTDVAALSFGPERNWAKQIWITPAIHNLTGPVVLIVNEVFDFWPVKRSIVILLTILEIIT